MENSKLKCVLLIDDDAPTNFFNKLIIERAHVARNIETAQSVKQALQLLEHPKQEACESPDLILLDINMPGLNGWDFLEAYRDLHKEGPVIIMLTTSVNPDDEVRAKKIDEVSGFRQKPLTMEVLDEIIEQHFIK